MRIGMVLNHRIPPPDIRVEKEAKTLLDAGHEIHLLLEGSPGREREEQYKGMSLLRGVVMGPLREKYHRYTFNFTFRDRMWRRAIGDFASSRKVDALHVHDLPFMREAVSVGRRLGLPVVADLHENYPAGLQVWYESSLKKRTIYNFERWARYEREVLEEVDAIVVVVEESKERLVGLGLPADRIYVVPNTASRDRGSMPIDGEIVDRYRGRFVLAYIGGFAPHRGLDTVIRAMPAVRARVPKALLLLVGDRNEPYRRYLQRLAGESGCGDAVEMTGWQPFEKIWSFIDASDVCLVPHARNPHTDTTIPHKIFQYMSVAKPVVVSDCPPLRRVVEDSGGGLWFAHDDPAGFAAAIIALHEDEGKRRAMGEAGRNAFLDRYNWESTSGGLLRLYERLAYRDR
ncbi:MAG TPA: glycosyltransferase WbuB [Candidatus Eisenbacteria bacterium]|uniref:Glycosyltransferase WbuB n=1 Tax=Eiseniibacteriota bacterium TaxID=2212470 RepID=A0A7V2AU42_UNCEI|nr:glycosyltransferase WbuB [Candidatus Eisenbacteria bacterium]